MNPITALVDHLMLPFLNFAYTSIVPNYGFAIILLTFAIKIIFFPLTNKQYKSMKVTQKLQPKIKELQEKFKKKDPKRLQQEMMKLWKENNANPLGGCLPALIQMPFFIAVFYTIKSPAFTEIIANPEVNSGLFTFWLKDLSYPDKFYILPALIALSTYLTQKMTPITPSPNQPNVMAFMPIMMFVISINMPSGVLLYWATSQLLSAGQQYLIMKEET